jgi:hypothetical protein
MLLQVTELECRLSASSSQLSSALESNSQHLKRYREAKAEAAGLAQHLDQVWSSTLSLPFTLQVLRSASGAGHQP